MGIVLNRFEDNQFFLDGLYYALLKVYSVASMNCGEVSCGSFLLNRLKMEEYRRGIRVGLISVRPVEDAEEGYDTLSLNRVALSTFTISDSVEGGISV